MKHLLISLLFRCLTVFLVFLSWTVTAAAFNFQSLPEIPVNGILDEDEQLLVTALVQVHDNNLEGALKNLKRVVNRNPEFQRHAIVVEVSESRLYVYEQRDGEPVLIGDYYATFSLVPAENSADCCQTGKGT